MIQVIDTYIYNLILNILNLKTTFLMTVISYIGSATILILVCIMFLILLKDKIIAIIMMINLTTVYLSNVIIKMIVARPRPEFLRLVKESGYSFPSGHAMVSTGFYGFLIYLSYKKIKNKALKSIIITCLSCLIFLIGASRIYLGVHYATDVIGGFIIGILYLIIFIKIIRGVKKWKEYFQ